jgi:hypothetical protein
VILWFTFFSLPITFLLSPFRCLSLYLSPPPRLGSTHPVPVSCRAECQVGKLWAEPPPPHFHFRNSPIFWPERGSSTWLSSLHSASLVHFFLNTTSKLLRSLYWLAHYFFLSWYIWSVILYIELTWFSDSENSILERNPWIREEKPVLSGRL